MNALKREDRDLSHFPNRIICQFWWEGRPPPSTEVTNSRGTGDILFGNPAVMDLQSVEAVHPSSSSPPVSPGRHRASARAGHCLDNNPRPPYRRDAPCSSSSASPSPHRIGGCRGSGSPASHTPSLSPSSGAAPAAPGSTLCRSYRELDTPTPRRCARGDRRSCPSCPGSSGTSDGAGSWVLFAVFLPYISPCFFLPLYAALVNSDQMLCLSRACARLILCCRHSNVLGTS